MRHQLTSLFRSLSHRAIRLCCNVYHVVHHLPKKALCHTFLALFLSLGVLLLDLHYRSELVKAT